jgi:tetratricopeptide (TPR) repeat protein
MKNGIIACTLLIMAVSCRTQQSAQHYFNEGAKRLEKGEYLEAMELYQKGLEIDPKSELGYNLVGMACRMEYNRTGDMLWRHKEIISFNQALEINPDYVPALINLGATYYYSGQKAKAAPYFRHALEIFPNHPEANELNSMIAEGESLQGKKHE